MKTMRSLVNSLTVCGVALAMVCSVAAETVSEVSAAVVRIKGSARYKVGSGPGRSSSKGDILKAGTVIETGIDSRVDLRLGEGTPPSARPLLAPW